MSKFSSISLLSILLLPIWNLPVSAQDPGWVWHENWKVINRQQMRDMYGDMMTTKLL